MTIESARTGRLPGAGSLPLVLGYVRVHLLMTPCELDGVCTRLAWFAEQEGYMLSRIYAEQVHTVPAAFEALIDEVVGEDIRTVVVPGMQHLKVLPASMKRQFEQSTSARIVAAVS